MSKKFIVLRDTNEVTPKGANILIGIPATIWEKMSEVRQDKCLEESTPFSTLRILGGETIYCGAGVAKVALSNGFANCIASTGKTGKNGGYTIELSPVDAPLASTIPTADATKDEHAGQRRANLSAADKNRLAKVMADNQGMSLVDALDSL